MAKKAHKDTKEEITVVLSKKSGSIEAGKAGKKGTKVNTKKVFSPTIVLNERFVEKQVGKAGLITVGAKSQVKDFFKDCMKDSVENNIEAALVNQAKGGDSILKMDLQLVAAGMLLRKNAGKDKESLQQAQVDFKEVLSKFKSSASKKLIAVIFPTREQFSQDKLDGFSNYMIENQSGISNTHKALCETGGGSRSPKLPGSAPSEKKTRNAVNIEDPIVAWVLKHFGAEGEAPMAILLQALAILQQLLTGELTVAEVREETGIVVGDEKESDEEEEEEDEDDEDEDDSPDSEDDEEEEEEDDE